MGCRALKKIVRSVKKGKIIDNKIVQDFSHPSQRPCLENAFSVYYDCALSMLSRKHETETANQNNLAL